MSAVGMIIALFIGAAWSYVLMAWLKTDAEREHIKRNSLATMVAIAVGFVVMQVLSQLTLQWDATFPDWHWWVAGGVGYIAAMWVIFRKRQPTK